MLPRPKSFAAKLLVLFVVVVAAAQFATWIIVSSAHHQQAHAVINDELQRAESAFLRNIRERNELLRVSAAIGVRDYAFKQLFSGEEIDVATLASALPNFEIAAKADVVVALTLEGKVITALKAIEPEGDIYTELAARADADPNSTATSFGYLGGELYSLVVAPVRAPDIVAWLLLGFRIDRDYAKTLKELTGVDVTFLDHRRQLLATTLPESSAQILATALPPSADPRMAMDIPLGPETALVVARRLTAGRERFATLAVQYSLDEKLKPARFVENIMLAVAIGSLALAVFISRNFARRLSRPIEQLADHTRTIARGDYKTPLTLQRDDELGRLADSFREMTAGLAERDLVRDLLDKNVSPEVATQLLRDGAALGGEERSVTILFADLRGFTTMSEQLKARDLLTLLNRYLDRMSREIERNGGVIDKFIGDAIMALFGAPVTQGDAADRAVAAALAMERALADLNRELVAEGRLPLGIGVGVNTASVIAGNIGSQRRLNYSVIGDGVNVASRLQSLTRTAEYQTNLIISAATANALRNRAHLVTRPLGTVHVKGRAEPIEIFAVEPTTVTEAPAAPTASAKA